MYVLALATDYDETIAHNGQLDPSTLAALTRLKGTGRRLILVTGRDLPDLLRVCPDVAIFDRVVAENGALLFDPKTATETVLTAAPSVLFVERLKQRGVLPLDVGRSIVATREPHETLVLEIIQELGLELQIIFNKGAVMVLPSGVNKATGLAAALVDLKLSPLNVVGVGDAENDHAFLASVGCAAAVANALPMVKAHAHVQLGKANGFGTTELIERIIEDDGQLMPPALHSIAVGVDGNESEVTIRPFDGSVLIAGASGIGKSTLATALTEKMVERNFEFCVFDPEGDYGQLEHAVSIGDAKTPPRIDEAVELLRKVGSNLVFNTQSLALADRPGFFTELMGHISMARSSAGRPHWLLIDEAHHLLPVSRGDVAQALSEKMSPAILVTVHPEAVLPAALDKVATVIALGPTATDVLKAFCNGVGEALPQIDGERAAPDDVLVWTRGAKSKAVWVKPVRPVQVHKRHTRKYAEGDLGRERSFYFRGPDNALNLRAQNLVLFLQIGEGVDDATWEHHLRAGDYSAWFRHRIKSEDLAEEAEEIEADRSLQPDESRRRIREAIEKRFTAPAEPVEAPAPRTRAEPRVPPQAGATA